MEVFDTKESGSEKKMRKPINNMDACLFVALSLVFPVLWFFDIKKGSTIITICGVVVLVSLVSLLYRIRREGASAQSNVWED